MARRLVAACIKQDTAHVGPFCSFFLTIADRPSSECRKEGGGLAAAHKAPARTQPSESRDGDAWCVSWQPSILYCMG